MFRAFLSASLVALLVLTAGHGQDPAKPATHKVRYEKVALDLVERGHLEAAVRTDIHCRLTARTKDSPLAGTIRSVIEDGTQVKAGQLLVELDDLELQDQLRSQQVTSAQARATLLVAETTLEIVRAQAESDLKTAEVAVRLGELDHEAFEQGEARKTAAEFKSRLNRADADVALARARLDEARDLAKQGKAPNSLVHARELRVRSAEDAAEHVRTEQEVWQKYARPRTVLVLKAKLEEARRTVDQVKRLAEARIVQAEVERTAKRTTLDLEQARQQSIKEQLKNTLITAPHDGMAVYYVSQAGRGAPLLAVGEPVREGQKLLTICDLRRMVAHVAVHEAMVLRIKPTQPVRVEIDAFPNHLLQGEVQRVATVARQKDWLERDARVYETVVRLKEADLPLRPGMTVSAIIRTGEHLDKALAVPSQAVVRSRDKKHYACWVQTPQGPRERVVTVGLNTGAMAVIQEGLKEGDEVFLEPRKFLTKSQDAKP